MSLSASLRCILSKTKNLNIHNVQILQTRLSSFRASPFVEDLGKINVKYEVSKDPEEWKYVERLLPPATVPKPQVREKYVSYWKPQSQEALKHPYYIQRTKNHMLPVYMKTTQNGMKRVTYIRKVQGNIWELEQDVKEILQKGQKRPIRSQVNEFVGYICVHGDHVNTIKDFLYSKNF